MLHKNKQSCLLQLFRDGKNTVNIQIVSKLAIITIQKPIQKSRTSKVRIR